MKIKLDLAGMSEVRLNYLIMDVYIYRVCAYVCIRILFVKLSSHKIFGAPTHNERASKRERHDKINSFTYKKKATTKIFSPLPHSKSFSTNFAFTIPIFSFMFYGNLYSSVVAMLFWNIYGKFFRFGNIHQFCLHLNRYVSKIR